MEYVFIELTPYVAHYHLIYSAPAVQCLCLYVFAKISIPGCIEFSQRIEINQKSELKVKFCKWIKTVDFDNCSQITANRQVRRFWNIRDSSHKIIGNIVLITFNAQLLGFNNESLYDFHETVSIFAANDRRIYECKCSRA